MLREEYIHMIADKSNRMRYSVDIYPQQNLIKMKEGYNDTLVETFCTIVYRGSSNVKRCVFCKGDHYNDECENFKL